MCTRGRRSNQLCRRRYGRRRFPVPAAIKCRPGRRASGPWRLRHWPVCWTGRVNHQRCSAWRRNCRRSKLSPDRLAGPPRACRRHRRRYCNILEYSTGIPAGHRHRSHRGLAFPNSRLSSGSRCGESVLSNLVYLTERQTDNGNS